METDWKKKYEEALERMKYVVVLPKNDQALRAMKETVFPELAESEDERIRKAALEGIEYLERKLGWDAIGDTDILDVKEYLEKQKEPKHAPCDLQKAFEDGQASIVTEPEKYGLMKMTEWSEEDERRYNQVVYLIEQYGGFQSESLYYQDKTIVGGGPKYILKSEVLTWFKALKNRGNFPKSNDNSQNEWGREDESMRSAICSALTYNSSEKHLEVCGIKLIDAVSWIKTGPTRWKPSKEQMDALYRARICVPYDCDVIAELYEQLQKLM